jgi:hypothetical protein
MLVTYISVTNKLSSSASISNLNTGISEPGVSIVLEI